jgi:hypothetical protein
MASVKFSTAFFEESLRQIFIFPVSDRAKCCALLNESALKSELNYTVLYLHPEAVFLLCRIK